MRDGEGSQSPEVELELTAGGKDEENVENGIQGAEDPATAGMALAGKRAADVDVYGDEIKGAEAVKRPRTLVQDAEGRSRQRRLFGVLTKTLSRFQEDTKKETAAVDGLSDMTGSSRLTDKWSNRAKGVKPLKSVLRQSCGARTRRSRQSLARSGLGAICGSRSSRRRTRGALL